jgi:acid phosphatase (class A)
VPEAEEHLRNNGSYVSGHSATGVAVSMVLACINPERQDQLYKRGLEFGESRWIVGFHHYSDVKAGQMVGALVLPALINNDEFMEQLAKAKKEFAKLAKKKKK